MNKKFLKELGVLAKQYNLSFETQDSTITFSKIPTTTQVVDKRNQYSGTFSHQELMKEHSLQEEGIWEIFGEDPNCDLGGHHSEPLLDTVEGTLDAALNHAVMLPSFWQWGAGGRLKKVVAKKIALGEPIKPVKVYKKA